MYVPRIQGRVTEYDFEHAGRALLVAVEKAFEDPEVQREFEEWQQKRKACSVDFMKEGNDGR